MFSREILNTLMPEGAAWEPVPEGDYDKLLDGIAENSEVVRVDMDNLRYLRDPARTIILSDMEKEYAIIPVEASTEEERRQRLSATMYRRNEKPTYEILQKKLIEAGFDVQVHANDPAVDPAIFLNQAYQMQAGELLPGGNLAQAGEPEAYAGQIGGELLVNGEQFYQAPNYSMLAGEPLALADEELAFAGQYNGITLTPIEYDIPVISGYWPLIFFVGGAATRDPGTGELTEIEIINIPIERRLEFRRIILKLKPMASWAGLIVAYS